jgi:hypothetical protein
LHGAGCGGIETPAQDVKVFWFFSSEKNILATLVKRRWGHHHGAMPRPVQIGAAADGTLTYMIDCAPSDLPAVRVRDIVTAWSQAREAAHRAAWSVARGFRFRRADGGWTDLALCDQDATCWAGAVDRLLGMETSYGVSVCLRLLALIDLLARAPWTTDLVDLSHEAELHPALVRLAAAARLTDDAGFDEHRFRLTLQTLPSGAQRP